MKKTILLCAAGTLAAVSSLAQVTFTWVDLGPFDGGSLTGTYDLSSLSAGLSMTGTGATYYGDATGGTLDVTGAGYLAFRSSGATTTGNGGGSRWDAGESWTFTLNQDLQTWNGISFEAWSNVADNFVIKSSQWIGLGGVTPTNGVTYDSVTGSFTFLYDSGLAQKAYTLVDMTGGTLLPVTAGTGITLQHGGGNANTISSLTFTVPEPSTYALLLGFGALGLVLVRRRMRN